MASSRYLWQVRGNRTLSCEANGCLILVQRSAHGCGFDFFVQSIPGRWGRQASVYSAGHRIVALQAMAVAELVSASMEDLSNGTARALPSNSEPRALATYFGSIDAFSHLSTRQMSEDLT